MPSRHLVPDLKFSFDGYVYLHHLYDSRGKVITPLDLLDLVVKNIFNYFNLLLEGTENLADLFLDPFTIDQRNLIPAVHRYRSQCLIGNTLPLYDSYPAVLPLHLNGSGFPDQKFFQFTNGGAFDNPDFVLFVLAKLRLFGLFNNLGTGILVRPLARKYLGADN